VFLQCHVHPPHADKHALIITKSGSYSNNPWLDTSYLQAFKSFRRRLELTYKRTRDPQVLSAIKSATNRYMYHHLLATAKKSFYSSLVQSRAFNPRLPWKTINQLLHRNISNPQPNFLPYGIAERVLFFFLWKNYYSSSLSRTYGSLCRNHLSVKPSSIRP